MERDAPARGARAADDPGMLGVRMDVYIARQPILDRASTVSGYELLFRTGLEDFCPQVDHDRASSCVITESLFLPRLHLLGNGKDLYFNVTREILVGGYLTMLPAGQSVIEMLETVPPDDEVLRACRDLREKGYRIALDDFAFEPERMRLLDVADIVKVDLLSCDAERALALSRTKRGAPPILLAEKVETRETYKRTLDLGYDLFQGYFFARPTIVSGRDIPASRLGYLQILREVNRRELDCQSICDIVEREIGLSYKLLRYINSAHFGFRGAVKSIRHAVLLLGQREIRRWASLIALAGIAEDESEELLTMALLRARFCELVAPSLGLDHRSDDLFLAGLFSMIDAILACPLEEILEDIPIGADVAAALLRRAAPLGPVLDLVIAYSHGDWAEFSERAGQLGLSERDVPLLYESAVEFCRVNMGSIALDRAA